MRQSRQLGGRVIDTEVFELNGVQVGRQAEIGPGFRQHFLADEAVVGSELVLELGESVLIAVHLVLFEQQTDAVQIGIGVFEILFDFELRRSK